MCFKAQLVKAHILNQKIGDLNPHPRMLLNSKEKKKKEKNLWCVFTVVFWFRIRIDILVKHYFAFNYNEEQYNLTNNGRVEISIPSGDKH